MPLNFELAINHAGVTSKMTSWLMRMMSYRYCEMIEGSNFASQEDI